MIRTHGLTHVSLAVGDPGHSTDIDRAVAEATRAGGKVLRQGEFAPGCPFAYVADPDGYEIEIWFEATPCV